MLCWMSQKSGTDLTKAQLEHAIKRNFSGYSESDIKPYEKFMSLLHLQVSFDIKTLHINSFTYVMLAYLLYMFQNTESARETKLLVCEIISCKK